MNPAAVRSIEAAGGALSDSLLKPQEQRELQRSLDDSVLSNPAFKDNFGTLANSAEYRSKTLKFLNQYNMNVYQVEQKSVKPGSYSSQPTCQCHIYLKLLDKNRCISLPK